MVAPVSRPGRKPMEVRPRTDLEIGATKGIAILVITPAGGRILAAMVTSNHETTSAVPFAVERLDDGVGLFKLEQPGSPVVVLDKPLIERIEATLQSLPDDLTGLILASASRVFVAGADLKSIQDPRDGSAGLDDAGLDAYLAYGQRVFGMLCALPYPTAAAINGAALGGGLELAMHCDGLIAAPPPEKDGQPGRPYPVGLPEAGLAICPGWGGTNLLPARMDPAEAIRRTAFGQPMNFDEAKTAGLFDRVAESPEAGALLETCRRWILEQREAGATARGGEPGRWIGRDQCKVAVATALPKIERDLPVPRTGSAQAVIEAVRAGIEQGRGWQAALDVERRELVRLRSTPEGRAAIKGFFEKSGKPK